MAIKKGRPANIRRESRRVSFVFSLHPRSTYTLLYQLQSLTTFTPSTTQTTQTHSHNQTNPNNLQPSKCSSTLSPSSPPWPLLPPLSRMSSSTRKSHDTLNKQILTASPVPSTLPFASRPLLLPQPHPLDSQPHPLDPQLHLVLDLLDPPASPPAQHQLVPQSSPVLPPSTALPLSA